jgi:hypothetical protein
MLRIAALSLLLAALPTHAEVARLHSPAAAESLGPSLVVDSHGQILLSWLQRQGRAHALHFSRLEGATFSEPGTIASGDDWFVNWADFPALGVLPTGALTAHWLQKSGPGRYSYDVRFSRSDDGGLSWSAPLTPHRDGTETEHGFVSHFAWSDDHAGLFWLDGRETAPGGHDHHGHAGAMTLRSAALAADGSISREALLDARVCDCCQTDAVISTSGPLVVYRGREADEVRDIMIVRWLGDRWSEPVPVHRDGWVMPACPVNGPQVVARGGDVAVAWFTMADGHARVLIARSLDGGASFDPPRLVADGSVLGRVGLAQAADGRRWLAWMDETEGDARLLLARFDAELEERDRQVVARLPRGRISGFPRLVHSPADGLVIAWTEAPEGRPQVAVARIRETSNP